ncbi:MAG: helix-turn-helix domain-containing protein [Candidatus Izemoplasmatales bacterium]|jgi:hypothetical protein|nr:helix-turn-helix domain-containing protein [Candidatus Izemoplasmatales bacterium]
MNQRSVHIYLKTDDTETLVSFLKGYADFAISEKGQYLKLTHSENDNQIDWNHLREKCLEELFIDICLFVEPLSPNFDPEPIIRVLPTIGYGVFTIENIIPRLVREGIKDVRTKLRNYYYNVFGAETIQTIQGFIRANLNQSVAAKKMYMHRNTLNYRLDHFIGLSEINVKSFIGAHAFFLLFEG